MTELIFTKKLDSLARGVEVYSTLTLPYHSRQKSRLRVTLDNGEEAGLLLPRGETLRDGQLLQSDDGKIVIRVRAARESVSTATTEDPKLLATACYHLGNRHVALQVGDNWCRYLHDHVLDEMVASLGLEVAYEQAPFEPEDGAYKTGGHHHHHHD
jgi:urease accessory protein